MSKCWYCNNELTSGDSPKHFGICNKCYDEMFKSSDTIISSFTNKISDLEAKLEESEKQRQHLKDWLDDEILTSVDNESYYATINEYEEEVKKLKQQLAEKDKEIEKWKTKWCESETNSLRLYEQSQNNNQDKILFAVEQLEKVKEFVNNIYGEYSASVTTNFIDNQIKQLKEGK